MAAAAGESLASIRRGARAQDLAEARGQGGPPVEYGQATEGDWYKMWKYDGSATGFYLAELNCPHSYYDKDEYCAMEFRCYLDDSDPNDPDKFSFTLHDDC